MLRRILLSTVAVFAATVPAAHAGTVSVSGTTITYQAAPGEENFLTVNWGNVGAGTDYIPTLDDHVDVTAVAPCTYDIALGARCPSAGTNPTYVVHLGDGNDIAESGNDHAAGHSVQLYGEDGDDRLQSGGSSDVLDGGPGNDELSPDEDDSGPGDVVAGGPGTDTLQTGNPTGTDGPIGVSFDGVANDGYPGEADNYAPDLENLSATGTSPAINFVGNDGPNVVQLRSESADTVAGLGGDDVIDGANGNDVLDGGDGNDTIYGGGNDDTIIGGPGLDSLSGEGSASGFFYSVAGNDHIDARDGVREQLNCGPGADTAVVDELDIVPQDPGSLCEAVERSGAPAGTAPTTPKAALPVPSISSSKLSVSKSRITVKIACKKGGDRCRGKLTLRTAAKVKVGKARKVVTVGSASYSVAAGHSASVRVKVGTAGRSLLRRVTSVRVRVSAAPSSGKATTRVVTLRG